MQDMERPHDILMQCRQLSDRLQCFLFISRNLDGEVKADGLSAAQTDASQWRLVSIVPETFSGFNRAKKINAPHLGGVFLKWCVGRVLHETQMTGGLSHVFASLIAPIHICAK